MKLLLKPLIELKITTLRLFCLLFVNPAFLCYVGIMSDLGPIAYMVSGGLGGICCVLVGHPFDTIKVRQQTLTGTTNSTFDCVKKTITNEGIRGLYKGMATPLLAVAPIFALSFSSYRISTDLILQATNHKKKLFAEFWGGAFSGLFTTVLLAPGERIKCLLQTQGIISSKLYRGPMDCAKKLYRAGGMANIYRGAGATLLRDVPASGLYFVTYETLREYFFKKNMNVFGTVLAGGTSGIVFWLFAMPFDVLKSLQQTAKAEGNLFSIANNLLSKEGPSAFYKGITPVLIRAFPANAACFLGVELGRYLFITIDTGRLPATT